MRSILEAVNSVIKRRLLSKIRKRKPEKKGTEEFFKVSVHNLSNIVI